MKRLIPFYMLAIFFQFSAHAEKVENTSTYSELFPSHLKSPEGEGSRIEKSYDFSQDVEQAKKTNAQYKKSHMTGTLLYQAILATSSAVK